jgi:hypothetical protein
VPVHDAPGVKHTPLHPGRVCSDDDDEAGGGSVEAQVSAFVASVVQPLRVAGVVSASLAAKVVAKATGVVVACVSALAPRTWSQPQPTTPLFSSAPPHHTHCTTRRQDHSAPCGREQCVLSGGRVHVHHQARHRPGGALRPLSYPVNPENNSTFHKAVPQSCPSQIIWARSDVGG